MMRVDCLLDRFATRFFDVTYCHELHVRLLEETTQVIRASITNTDAAYYDALAGCNCTVTPQRAAWITVGAIAAAAPVASVVFKKRRRLTNRVVPSTEAFSLGEMLFIVSSHQAGGKGRQVCVGTQFTGHWSRLLASPTIPFPKPEVRVKREMSCVRRNCALPNASAVSPTVRVSRLINSASFAA